HDPCRGNGLRLAAPRLRPLVAGDPRRALHLLRSLRALPRRVAVRGRTRRGVDRGRDRGVGGCRIPLHLGDRAVGRLPTRHVPDRRPPLLLPHRHRTVLGTRDRARAALDREPRRRRAPDDHRRRRTQRAEPAPRAERDPGRARRRLRRRRPGSAGAAHPGDPRDRDDRPDRLDPRPCRPGRRPRDDPECPRRPHRRRRRGVPARRHLVRLRAPADRPPARCRARRSARMSTLARTNRRVARDADGRPRAAFADRALAAVPLTTAYLWLCIVYCVEAWKHATPWLFTDELEFTQISRSIADPGHPARRGQAYSFHSLYDVLTAPIWLIHSVATAYAGIKYFDVFLMTSVMLPTYLLARMVVRKPWALFAAVGASVIPSLAYSSWIVDETLAYPFAALCFW